MALASCLGLSRFFNRVQSRVGTSRITTWINDREKDCALKNIWAIRCCAYSRYNDPNINTSDDGSEVKSKKKKKTIVPRVTLLSENDEMSVVTLEMAQKISNGRNLKLVKIVDMDTKTSRPTYKLMSSKQYLQEGLELRKQKKQQRETALKPEKLLTMSSNINEHDFQTKIKNIVKLLSKRHEIRILISMENKNEKAEAMFTRLSTAVKDHEPTITKVVTSRNLKIHLLPNLELKTLDTLDNAKEEYQNNTDISPGS